MPSAAVTRPDELKRFSMEFLRRVYNYSPLPSAKINKMQDAHQAQKGGGEHGNRHVGALRWGLTLLFLRETSY